MYLERSYLLEQINLCVYVQGEKLDIYLFFVQVSFV